MIKKKWIFVFVGTLIALVISIYQSCDKGIFEAVTQKSLDSLDIGNGEKTAKLSWDANAELDIVGYKVYMRQENTEYEEIAIVDKPNILSDPVTFTVKGLANENTYFFVVTAFNTSELESEYSQEAFKK